MKRPLLILAALFIITLNATAQQFSNQKAFTIGGELNIPSFGLYTVGTGVSAKLEFPIASPVSISLTAGFTSFFYRSSILNNYNGGGSDIFVPLKAGVKYYLAQGFYAEGELGEAMELNYNKSNLVAFSVGPGFIVPAGKNAVDISFRYEDWEGQIKQTALRFAYRFGW